MFWPHLWCGVQCGGQQRCLQVPCQPVQPQPLALQPHVSLRLSSHPCSPPTCASSHYHGSGRSNTAHVPCIPSSLCQTNKAGSASSALHFSFPLASIAHCALCQHCALCCGAAWRLMYAVRHCCSGVHPTCWRQHCTRRYDAILQVHHDSGHNWEQLMASTLSKWSPCWYGLWQQWQPHHFRELNNLFGECGQDCAEAEQAILHRTDRRWALQVPSTQ